jgi:adenylyltransferase/sulfurtransferase
MLSNEERGRYARHLILPQVGLEGQLRMKSSSVLVVGAGGLGCPLIQYLAAAGIGKLGIIDFDKVDESNLQRQVLYGMDDVGQFKAERAAAWVRRNNPHIKVLTFLERLDSSNAERIFAGFDIVVDGTDNFPTRYLVNDACVLFGKTNVHGSIFRFDGQVSVFNRLRDDGSRGPNYRDLYPSPPPPGSVPSCAEGGVLGVLPGLIGCVQAAEVIKLAAGIGEPLDGQLWILDALSMQTRIFRYEADPGTPQIKELIDYEAFCGAEVSMHMDTNSTNNPMKEINVQELKRMRDEGEDFQLIDVREPGEFEIANIGGELIPLADVVFATEKIARDKKVILHCRSGKRSANAIHVLEQRHGFDNLYNLEGGILAWAQEIDPSMPQY